MTTIMPGSPPPPNTLAARLKEKYDRLLAILKTLDALTQEQVEVHRRSAGRHRQDFALLHHLHSISLYEGATEMTIPHGPITGENMPKALGPYSHAVRAGDLLFLAGQAGLDPTTGAPAEHI